MEFDETQLFLLKGTLLFFIKKRKKLKSKRLKQSFNKMKLNGKDLHENINVFVRKFDKKIKDKRYFPDDISYIFFRMEKDDSIKDDIKLKWDEAHRKLGNGSCHVFVRRGNSPLKHHVKIN